MQKSQILPFLTGDQMTPFVFLNRNKMLFMWIWKIQKLASGLHAGIQDLYTVACSRKLQTCVLTAITTRADCGDGGNFPTLIITSYSWGSAEQNVIRFIFQRYNQAHVLISSRHLVVSTQTQHRWPAWMTFCFVCVGMSNFKRSYLLNGCDWDAHILTVKREYAH